MIIGDKQDVLFQKRVLVIGLGGVGSYVVEGLVRAGVGSLTLVDFDVISLSNLNRQLMTDQTNIGILKAECLARRAESINPSIKVNIEVEKIRPENIEFLKLETYDFVVDAIDDVPAKVEVIAYCNKRGIPIISALGTGNKLDPERLRITDISKTNSCPLAKVVRVRLRQLGINHHVVAFSDEVLDVSTKERVPGSMVFVPGACGLLIASYVVRKLLGYV